MAQIDSYIRRVNKECNLTHLEDIYDLYEFIPNEDLRTLFAAFHTQLNYWFSVINSDILCLSIRNCIKRAPKSTVPGQHRFGFEKPRFCSL